MPDGVKPAAITFSGGVSEYIYGRETRDFGDIARSPGASPRRAATGASRRRSSWPREGIRATVIGASQFTVQVSGKTIHIGARRHAAAAQRAGHRARARTSTRRSM